MNISIIKNKFYLNQVVNIKDCKEDYIIGLISIDEKMNIWYQLYRISDGHVCSVMENMLEPITLCDIKDEFKYEKHSFKYQVTWQKANRIKEDETYMHYYDTEKRAKECADLLKLNKENENIKVWEVTECRKCI